MCHVLRQHKNTIFACLQASFASLLILWSFHTGPSAKLCSLPISPASLSHHRMRACPNLNSASHWRML